jgi:opacity protein-like surface antigen
MIHTLRTAVIISGLLLSAPAFAADFSVAPPAADAPSRAYATVFAGASLPHSHVSVLEDGAPIGPVFDLNFDRGYIVGGAVGATILPSLRGEVEFSVVNSTVSNFLGSGIDFNSTGYNVLGNLWYDVDTGTSFTPYIGGGLGYGYDVVTSDEPGEANTSGWLYQLGAGVRFAATDNIGVDLAYRYRVQPDATISGDNIDFGDAVPKSNATNHIVTSGVTVNF